MTRRAAPSRRSTPGRPAVVRSVARRSPVRLPRLFATSIAAAAVLVARGAAADLETPTGTQPVAYVENPQVAIPVLGSHAGGLLETGLLTRLHMGSKAKLDVGAVVPIELGASGQDLGLKAPVEFAVNIIEAVYVGLDSGFGITSLTKAP